MIKQPYTFHDMANSHVQSRVTKVIELFRNEAKAAGYDGGDLIIEAIGGTIQQNAWTDVCGEYVTYRITPLFSSHPKLRAAALRAENAFSSLGKDFKKVPHDPGNPNTLVTLYVTVSQQSTGD